MRKIVLFAKSCKVANAIVDKAKKMPGVTYAKKYMSGGHYHCMITGDFSDEVEMEICGHHRNQAEMAI